jgi:hypothetical protein
MKTFSRSMWLAAALAVGIVGVAASPARAQGFGFAYNSPGFSMGIGTPGYGFYGGSYYGPYPYVAPAPVVVPGPVVAPAPFIVQRPFFPRRFYGYGYGYRYRPYPYGYRRWW